MKLILWTAPNGKLHLDTEGAVFFTITPGGTPNIHAHVKSHLPGLMDFHGRDVDAAVEHCVTSLGTWMRKYLGGRVPIEIVDERDKDRKPWRTTFDGDA